MENLNAEEVKKWLEICAEDTPYPDQSQALLEALALINSQEQKTFELENRLKECRADTVKKMQEQIKTEYKDCCRYVQGNREYFIVGEEVIDQVAKEILERK